MQSAVSLASDFSCVEKPDGERIAFTRSERRLLEVLSRQPNRLLTRDQLLDALTGPGSDKGARNIDFLINRLRHKLMDDARAPAYIATRYGEGYVWVGPPPGLGTDLAAAYLVVGPLRGLGNLGGERGLAERFASDLRLALRSVLPPDQQVALAPDCPPSSAFNGSGPSLSIQLAFFEETGAVNCVATARDFRSGRILAVRRLVLPGDERARMTRCAGGFARSLLDEIWRTLAAQTEDGLPLPVLMQMASTRAEPEAGTATDSGRRLGEIVSRHENRTMAAWKEAELRLRGLLEADPNDAALKIMYATHIHSRYVQHGHILFRDGAGDRARDEAEMERLVLEALPHVQSQPEYAIMAAKLLHFLDRGYFDLACDLSEEAYRSSVPASGLLATVGQLRAFRGEIDAAMRCIDQALNLVERGSMAYLYTLVIKMQALRAAADFERLDEARREFAAISPAGMFFLEPLFAHPERPSLRARTAMLMLSRARAAAILASVNYVSARLFRDTEHRANAILSPLALFVRRFGKAGIPAEVSRTHCGLLDRFA